MKTFMIIFLYLLTISVHAATIVWGGSLGGDWDIGTNWIGGSVPTAIDDVEINSGEAFIGAATSAFAKSVIVADVAKLTIKGTLTIDGATDNGLLNNGEVDVIGILKVYNTGSNAIRNFTTASIFSNSGTIDIGETDIIGNNGISNLSLFENQGIITIDTCHANGIYNSSSATMTNSGSGEIQIGINTHIEKSGIENTGTIDNAGIINIDETLLHGIYNYSKGDITNQAGANIFISGTTVDNTRAIWNSGANALIDNFGTINIDNTTDIAIFNQNFASFNNQAGGVITMGSITQIKSGISNQFTAEFRNFGDIIIDNCLTTAIGNARESAHFTNEIGGSIILGATTNIDQWGIKNSQSGIFDNFASIQIDDTQTGIGNGSLGGTFTNHSAGVLDIGATKPISSDGIRNYADFINSGIIHINRTVNSDGIENNGAYANFTNQSTGSIIIGNIAPIASHGINNSGTYTNSGSIQIDYTSFDGIKNYQFYISDVGLFTNENTGNIQIGSVHSIGLSGINNKRTFVNKKSITINDCAYRGLVSNSSSSDFDNSGTLTIGNLSSIASTGIEARHNFNNSGYINIDNVGGDGIGVGSASTFTNESTGIIKIGAIGNIGASGINTFSSFFTNDGSIQIDNTSSSGIHFQNLNTIRKFSNSGNIDIGQNGPVGSYGFSSLGVLINSGTINIDQTDRDGFQITSSIGQLDNTSSGIINIGINFPIGVGGPNFDGISNGNTISNNGTITIANVSRHGISSTGLYKGTGIATFESNFNTQGKISPGNSPGTITLIGNLDHTSTNAVDTFELAGISGGGSLTGHDSISVDGDLTLNGKLNIQLLSGFVPAVSDQFTIIAYTGTLTGTYSSIEFPSPEMDGWVVDYSVPGKVIIASAPLPLKLIQFSAKLSPDHHALLSWTTAEEINSSHFEIEHSRDAKSWEVIGRVKASGNRHSLRNYQFDYSSPSINNFFRLKMVDLDGIKEYSKIISLLNDDFSFSIFPNPANQYLQISSDQKIKQIEILDNTGQSVFVTDREDKELNISFLESGVYYLKIDNQKLKRFVKL